jgi:Family of unknown function (DUF6492)
VTGEIDLDEIGSTLQSYPQMPTTALFIRSYSKDFPWLAYCLRSIQKFATGFSEIVIVIPDTDSLDHLTVEKVFKEKETMDGYMMQQASKMSADTYTEADFICFVDSDCCFVEPVTPETFMTAGRVNWLYTPWSKIAEETRVVWQEVMKRCIGEEPPAEFMRRHPQVIPRWALQEFRGFVAEKHGVSLEHYISVQPGKCYSEFNTIGFFLWLHHHEKIHWMNTEDFLPPTVLLQKWSWGGLTPEIRAELEAITA